MVRILKVRTTVQAVNLQHKINIFIDLGLLENRPDLSLGPDVAAALALGGFGVLSAVQSAFRAPHLAHDIIQRFAQHLGVERVAGAGKSLGID